MFKFSVTIVIALIITMVQIALKMSKMADPSAKTCVKLKSVVFFLKFVPSPLLYKLNTSSKHHAGVLFPVKTI